MPQVERVSVKQRAALLRDKVAAKRDDWLQSLAGSTQKIAVEKGGMGGHAENFAYVKLDRQMDEGAIVSAHITGASGGQLKAEIPA